MNPPAGTHPILITFDRALEVSFPSVVSVATAFTGVNQSTPIRGSSLSVVDSGGSISNTVPSAVGDMVWDAVCAGTSVDSTTENLLAIDNVSNNTSCDNIGASTKSGAASVTMNWTVNTSHNTDDAVDFAASIEPAHTILKPPNNLGLVGYWSFDEGAGTIAHDFSANQNAGTINGTPVWVNGKHGKALNFDGSSNRVDAGNHSSLDITGLLTVSAWVKAVPGAVAPGEAGDIVSKEDGHTVIIFGSVRPTLCILDSTPAGMK